MIPKLFSFPAAIAAKLVLLTGFVLDDITGPEKLTEVLVELEIVAVVTATLALVESAVVLTLPEAVVAVVVVLEAALVTKAAVLLAAAWELPPWWPRRS